MRDSRLGTYGVAGLGLMLAAKVLALTDPPEVITLAAGRGHAASRSSAVLALAMSSYVIATFPAQEVRVAWCRITMSRIRPTIRPAVKWPWG